MGERLVVTIIGFDEPIAEIYYHWSAYTGSALRTARDMVKYIKDKNLTNYKDKKALQLALIRMCESQGGGIRIGDNSEGVKYVKDKFPNEEFRIGNACRNSGIIAIDETGMAELRRLAEGNLLIDLDIEGVYNDTIYCYESIDEYNDWLKACGFEDMCIQDLDEAPEIGFDLCNIQFDDLDNLTESVDLSSGRLYRYGNTIYETK